MSTLQKKLIGTGLTFDDVLLVPSYADFLPTQVSLKTKFSKNIDLNIPIVSAAMDTVTESAMAAAMIQNGGLGIIHRYNSIEVQSSLVGKALKKNSGIVGVAVGWCCYCCCYCYC